MKKIFKYQLEITDRQIIKMPQGAKILSVQNQHNTLTLWAEVNPTSQMVDRYFQVFGTGHPIEDELGDYLATVLTDNDRIVWHVFVVPENPLLPQ
jgi:hypothetical protein